MTDITKRLNEIEARANVNIAVTDDDDRSIEERIESDAVFASFARTDIPWLIEQVKLRDKVVRVAFDALQDYRMVTASKDAALSHAIGTKLDQITNILRGEE